MTDTANTAEIDRVLTQFRTPVRNIPFPTVVRAMADKAVIPIDTADPRDAALIASLSLAAKAVAAAVRADPIRRNRPNEVGNDIEPFVMTAARSCGLRAERPRSAGGHARTTGYPDLLVHDGDGRPTYLECKIFGDGSALTTMRSFYLSPSDQFKVSIDARHLLLAFSVVREPISDSRDSFYIPVAYKLIDLHGLTCDVKYEFNADNRRLYAPGMILAGDKV